MYVCMYIKKVFFFKFHFHFARKPILKIIKKPQKNNANNKALEIYDLILKRYQMQAKEKKNAEMDFKVKENKMVDSKFKIPET